MQPVTRTQARRRFRPRLGWTLLAIVSIAATVALGRWQVGRAQEKLATALEYDRARGAAPVSIGAGRLSATEVEHRRLEAQGRFEPQHAILLDNRVRQGVVGYHVVMPLRLGAGTRYVLVNRGWIAGTGSRQRLPEVKTPPSEIVVTGFAAIPGKRIVELDARTVEGKVWQNLTVERYARHTGLDVEPVVLMQENDTKDGLVREWARPDFGAATHKSYAFQWFALALLILVIYLALSFRRDAPKS